MALLAASDDEDMNNDPLFNPLARNSNAAEEKEAFSYVPAVTSASSTSLSSVAISTSNPLDTPVASVSVSDANSHVSLGDDNDRDPPPVPAKDSSSSASSSSYTAQTPARAPAPAEPPKPTGPCCATHTAILKWLQMYPSTPAADSDGDRKNMIQIDNATKVCFCSWGGNDAFSACFWLLEGFGESRHEWKGGTAFSVSHYIQKSKH